MEPAISGRKPKLTPELQDQIVTLIRRGVSRELACGAVGISSRTLRRWLDRASDNGPRRRAFKEFRAAVEQAEAQVETALVGGVVHAGKKDWRALAWYLERRFGVRWNPKRQANEAGATPQTLAELFALAWKDEDEQKDKEDEGE